MGLRLKNDFQGAVGERIPHDWLNTIANFWNDLQVVGGGLNRRGDGHFTTITINSASDSPLGPVAAASLPFVNYFIKTSSTGGNWVPGKTYFAGTLLSVTNEPSTITVDASHYRFWITVDFSASTATWGSGTAFPAMTDSTEVYRMLDVTLNGSNEIDTFRCPTPHDIHVTAKSS